MNLRNLSLDQAKNQARALGVAAAFGLAALAIVAAKFFLPIPGSEVVTDPRELFTTIGAALTGPWGGILIGILAGILEPDGIPLTGILAHVSGGLWMGFSYKLLVYNRLQMPVRLVGWAGLVLVYYYAVVVPGFVIGPYLFYPESVAQGGSPIQEYLVIAKGATPEAGITILVTGLVLAALPSRHQRPLW